MNNTTRDPSGVPAAPPVDPPAKIATQPDEPASEPSTEVSPLPADTGNDSAPANETPEPVRTIYRPPNRPRTNVSDPQPLAGGLLLQRADVQWPLLESDYITATATVVHPSSQPYEGEVCWRYGAHRECKALKMDGGTPTNVYLHTGPVAPGNHSLSFANFSFGSYDVLPRPRLGDVIQGGNGLTMWLSAPVQHSDGQWEWRYRAWNNGTFEFRAHFPWGDVAWDGEEHVVLGYYPITGTGIGVVVYDAHEQGRSPTEYERFGWYAPPPAT